MMINLQNRYRQALLVVENLVKTPESYTEKVMLKTLPIMAWKLVLLVVVVFYVKFSHCGSLYILQIVKGIFAVEQPVQIAEVQYPGVL